MRVWWRADIDARLDSAPESLKRAYLGMLSGYDAVYSFNRGADDSDQVPRVMPSVMRSYAVAGVMTDRWLRLGQAGAEPSSGRIGLGVVAVDLKAALTAPSGTVDCALACGHVIERGEEILRPSRQSARAPQHILLLGGPGQGKTTLGQLVCQAYRVALLDERVLSADTCDVVGSLRRDLQEAGIPVPGHGRWPVRITLHEYASALSSSESDTYGLLEFIACQVGHGVTVEAVHGWLRDWPWLLVLDGLDEVPRTVREVVMEQVGSFLTTARLVDADLLVVGTTRPQGYRGEFHSGDFQCLTLTELTVNDALHYAGRLAEARHHDDPEACTTVVERISAAAKDPTTRQLLGSPLQVAIMSLLVEKRRRLPHNRYELFDAYYGTIYAREADKPTRTGELLVEYRRHIDWLHRYVGLTLQADEAVTNGWDPLVMAEETLRECLHARLLAETENPGRSRALVDELVEVATDRLVLLVAPRPGTVGFEVKSLQEFCAARALLSGPDADIVPNLEPLATDPTWYQAWLLAAVGLFADHPHLRDEFLVMLRGLDSRGLPERLLLPGAHLALALLSDDLAQQHPRHHTRLVQHAAELITAPGTFEYDYMPHLFGQPTMAAKLAHAAAHSHQARKYLEDTAKATLVEQGLRAVYCLATVTSWAAVDGCLQPAARALLESAAQRMRADQRSAVRLFASVELRGRLLPGLPAYELAGSGEATTLAEFLPSPSPAEPLPGPLKDADGAARCVADWASYIPVTYELVEGIAVPLVDQSALRHGAYLPDGILEWEWHPDAKRICAEAALAQPATGWSITQALQYGLHSIARWDSSFPPSVKGVN
ncbi:hypothetical protein GCM10020229_10470 [Kitasatospora albolonga]